MSLSVPKPAKKATDKTPLDERRYVPVKLVER